MPTLKNNDTLGAIAHYAECLQESNPRLSVMGGLSGRAIVDTSGIGGRLRRVMQNFMSLSYVWPVLAQIKVHESIFNDATVEITINDWLPLDDAMMLRNDLWAAASAYEAKHPGEPKVVIA